MGILIDLREELRLRVLARKLVEDLCVNEEVVEEAGGLIPFCKELMAAVDELPEGNSETILEDYPELFDALRKKAAVG
tara:strand:+ start:3644 stop:3877 length:234 start_codon:yes stop_codon:yes gene_type:complete